MKKNGLEKSAQLLSAVVEGKRKLDIRVFIRVYDLHHPVTGNISVTM